MAIFTVGVEVAKVVGLKIGSIENAADQTINAISLALGLGFASGIHPTH